MPVAKLIGGTPDSMIADERNDSVDTLIRQAIGKDHLFSFPRAGDGPYQLIQLLHGLDQQDNAGIWPMLTPLKFQMQKCDKCSREFYSPINYRRHMRLHRRSLNFDKESRKYRDFLGAFWDKLSVDEVNEVVWLQDVSIKDIPGSSLVEALEAALRTPGSWTLPQNYVDVATAMLDVIQPKHSRLPMTSQELFSILDDASERTFLCAGTAESVQKYIFDEDAVKNSLELNNLVACSSFLLEQKLVKAWFAHKDAEALRCQKLLFEEEEAAKKKQDELLERKKLKKLKQKEKEREQSNWGSRDLEPPSDSFEGPTAEISILPSAAADSNCNTPEVDMDISSSRELVQLSNNEDMDIEAQLNLGHQDGDLGAVQNVEPRPVSASSRRHFHNVQWQVPKSQKMGRNGFHNQNNQSVKLEPIQKHGVFKDRYTPVNNSKIWTRKVRVQNDESLRLEQQKDGIDQNQSNCEVMIGSISVPVKYCSTRQQANCPDETRDDFDSTEPAIPKKCNLVEKPAKHDALQNGTNGAAVKLWMPVNRQGSGLQGPEEVVITGNMDERNSYNENCLRSGSIDNHACESKNYTCQDPDGCAHQSLGFSSIDAKAFLRQRWKETISADHVKLVLNLDAELSRSPDKQDDQTDNRMENVRVRNGNAKAKFRHKPEKSIKTKYIPKQKPVI